MNNSKKEIMNNDRRLICERNEEKSQNNLHLNILRFPQFNLLTKPSIIQLNSPSSIRRESSKESKWARESKRKRQIEAIQKQLNEVTEQLKYNIGGKDIIYHQHQDNSHNKFSNIPWRLSDPQIEWGRKSGKIQKHTDKIQETFKEKDNFYSQKIKSKQKQSQKNNYFDEFLVGEEMQIKQQMNDLKHKIGEEMQIRQQMNDLKHKIVHIDPIQRQQTSLTPCLISSISSSTSSDSSLSLKTQIINEKTFMKKPNPYIVQQKKKNHQQMNRRQ